jgi:phosphatidylserine/phosphatidylglycerophosphate/cardiolipin synthase-like enzyme
MKSLLLFFISVTILFSFDKLYFLPKDKKEVKANIIKLLQNSKNSVDIAMYNFTYNKFLKALKKANKNGSKITLIYDKTNLKFPEKFSLYKSKRKLHTKLAIIDSKYVIFGSANWKKESFSQNYEIIHITDEKEVVKKFIAIFHKIKKEEK